MRGFLAAAVAASFLFAGLPAEAQRAAQTEARTARPAPAVRFRARTASERLATIARLAGSGRNRSTTAAPQALANLNLTDSFTLTPRALYAPGHGSANLGQAAGLIAGEEPTGYAWFRAGEVGSIELVLTSPAQRRLLVECTVASTPAGLFEGRLSAPGGQAWLDTSAPYDGVISFLTPPIATSGAIEFHVRKADLIGIWQFDACEITRLNLP